MAFRKELNNLVLLSRTSRELHRSHKVLNYAVLVRVAWCLPRSEFNRLDDVINHRLSMDLHDLHERENPRQPFAVPCVSMTSRVT